MGYSYLLLWHRCPKQQVVKTDKSPIFSCNNWSDWDMSLGCLCQSNIHDCNILSDATYSTSLVLHVPQMQTMGQERWSFTLSSTKITNVCNTILVPIVWTKVWVTFMSIILPMEQNKFVAIVIISECQETQQAVLAMFLSKEQKVTQRNVL